MPYPNISKIRKVIDNSIHIHKGWSNACSIFNPDSSGNIDLHTFFDNDLNWSHNKFYWRLNHIKDFIAFWHSPFSIGDIYPEWGKPFHPKVLDLLHQKCKGLFFLSETECAKFNSYFKSIGLNIKCNSLLYPIYNFKNSFCIKSFLQSKPKRILQSGKYCRKVFSIFNLNVPNNFQKEISPWDSTQENRLKSQFSDLSKLDLTSIKKHKDLSIEKYISFYCDSLIYLDLYDVVACTAVLDCISTNCPIVLNRHPANIEYLGEDYPLFFNDPKEVYDLISDSSKIESAHLYLKNMDKSKLSLDYFKHAFLNSEIYRSL